MSAQLYEYAKRFAVGEITADGFSNTFIDLWKQERDSVTNMSANDSNEMSESLSTIYCLADLYNPESDREEFELDESKLRLEVKKVLGM